MSNRANDNTLVGTATKLIDALRAVTVEPLRQLATAYLAAMTGDYGAWLCVFSWVMFVGVFWVLMFGMLAAIVGAVAQ